MTGRFQVQKMDLEIAAWGIRQRFAWAVVDTGTMRNYQTKVRFFRTQEQAEGWAAKSNENQEQGYRRSLATD